MSLYSYRFKCILSVEETLVSTRKKRQSNRKFLTHLDDFQRDKILGNAASDRQVIVVFNEGTIDQELTVNNSGSNFTGNEISLNVKTLEKSFHEMMDKEMGTIVDIVEDGI